MSNYSPLHGRNPSEQISMSNFREELGRERLSPPESYQPADAKKGLPDETHVSLVSDTSYDPSRSLGPGGSDKGIGIIHGRSHRGRKVFLNWWKETVACVLAIAAAVATLGVLYPYQGNPLPQWPYLITVNALISAFMVVLKTSCGFLLAEGLGHQKWKWFGGQERPLYDFALHDEATRGPFGAARLLWRLSLHHVWHWLGCILILLALFVDPFTQQVLHYTDCNILVQNGVASIPRTNVFAGNGTHIAAGRDSITNTEQAALNAGIVAPGSAIEMQCSSGNCTFSPYGSLGYCSTCTDISDHTKWRADNYSVHNISYPGVRTWVDQEGGLEVNLRLGAGYSNFSTVGLLADGTIQFVAGMGFANGQAADAVIGPFDPANGGSPSGCDGQAAKDTWRCKGYGAANCTLYPCVRTYNASVENGVLHETLLAETAPGEQYSSPVFGFSSGAGALTTINATCLTPAQQDFLRTQNYTINSTTEWIPYNMSGMPGDTGPIPPLISNSTELNDFEHQMQAQGCLYGMSFFFPPSFITYYMTGAFTGNLTGGWGTYGGNVAQFQGPQILQTLYNYGDYGFDRTDALFKNMSTSFTNYMRTNPGYNITDGDPYHFTAPVPGSAYQDKVCLKVQWPWLALSWSLVFFTIVFFFGTLLNRGNLSDDVRTWKSSPLPMMFYGYQEPTGAAQRNWVNKEDLQDLETMEMLAKKMNVRLLAGGDGAMYLVEQQREAREW